MAEIIPHTEKKLYFTIRVETCKNTQATVEMVQKSVQSGYTEEEEEEGGIGTIKHLFLL